MAVSSLLIRLLLFLVKAVFLIETIDPTIRLCEPLLAREERVAVAAGVDADFLKCGTGLECRTACDASDGHCLILGVNTFFHTFALLPP